MDELDKMIRASAIARLASIFGLPVSKMRPDLKFGVDLEPTFVSDFRNNELDQINDDIRDVADREIMKELDTGQSTIRTVGDYCDHMIRCSEVRPKDVKRLLRHA